jgi:hypothetical protein
MKVSSAIKDAFEFASGFGKGYGEVINAEFVIHQYQPEKKTGRQQDPGTFLRLTTRRYTDETFTTPVPNTEDAEDLLKVATARKDSHTGAYVFGVRPGMGKSREDEAPVDQGSVMGTTGNTLFAEEMEGNKLNKKGKYLVFCNSLEQSGWKPQISAASWAPDFIGLRAEFDQFVMDKVDPTQEGEPPTCLIVKKGRIFRYPYEHPPQAPQRGNVHQVGAAAAAPVAAAAAPAAAAGAAPAQTTSAASPVNGAADATLNALLLLQQVAANLPGQTLSKKQLFLQVCSKAASDRLDKGVQRSIQTLMMDQKFIDEQAAMVGYRVEGDNVIFPA